MKKPKQLFLLIFFLVMVFNQSYAQIDSILNRSGRQLNKTEEFVSRINVKSDSVINTIQQAPLKYTDKVKEFKNSRLKKMQNGVSEFNEKPDSVLEMIQDIPAKYYKKVDAKIEKYSDRITGKTEKTLAKLSRWENKIKELLEKASPETAKKLFAPNQMTFSSLLQKFKEGKAVAENYKSRYYDEYRDKLSTSIKYVASQKDKLEYRLIQPVMEANKKIDKLEADLTNTEAVASFIKERKKMLMDEAVKYIGRSKYLTKINKEAYYYVETLKNYKELFSNPKKIEETAGKILNNIPAYKKFIQENGVLASLFGMPANYGTTQSLIGLQTRQSINMGVQNISNGGGANVKEVINQNMQLAQAELNKLKDKVLRSGGGSSNKEIPDFKPNTQKTKTFLQRLEYGANIQFAKNNSLMPPTADIGLSVGYKINDKSLIGIGTAYKVGFGSFERIRITHQGLGFRSFIDWKLKKQFFLSGGFEMNYNAPFKNIDQLQNYGGWKESGLIGVSKKISFKSKKIKGTNIQLLYDFLYKRNFPVSQPVIFRTGYSF